VTTASRGPAWDFDYAPVARSGDDGAPCEDLIVATSGDLDAIEVTEALAGLASDVAVTPLFASHPVFWTRIQSTSKLDRAEVTRRLRAKGVRYVASARLGSQRLAPPLDVSDARSRLARDWQARPSTQAAEPDSPWRWFLRSEGVDVVRSICGTGAGTRLAVIDNDGLDLERIALDAEVPIGVTAIPRSQSHAAIMLAWTVGTRSTDGAAFRGVAPDATPRYYCIPKPGDDVWTLPLAIARAVEDGADVVVCATYVEGQMSPMLDDALDFATKLGRGGRGTPVVMPTGREMSSPPDSMHSSLSLALSDPAADPRVFCIGPSARDGSWFLWRDRRGQLRPFANRGPSVRWLAPGDDLAYPFSAPERPWHAESSGASGIACGVMLLVLATNPGLTIAELERLLTETAVPTEPDVRAGEASLADERDLLPLGRDRDGHNAKHGYGRLSARAACLAASDPIALTLARMGEMEAAHAYFAAREAESTSQRYSKSLALVTVKQLLSDGRVGHAVASILRALRVWSGHPERLSQQPGGQLLRQIGLALRLLATELPDGPEREELLGIEVSVRAVQAGAHASEVEVALLAALARATAWDSSWAPLASLPLVGRPPGRQPGSESALARPDRR